MVYSRCNRPTALLPGISQGSYGDYCCPTVLLHNNWLCHWASLTWHGCRFRLTPRWRMPCHCSYSTTLRSTFGCILKKDFHPEAQQQSPLSLCLFTLKHTSNPLFHHVLLNVKQFQTNNRCPIYHSIYILGAHNRTVQNSQANNFKECITVVVWVILFMFLQTSTSCGLSRIYFHCPPAVTPEYDELLVFGVYWRGVTV